MQSGTSPNFTSLYSLKPTEAFSLSPARSESDSSVFLSLWLTRCFFLWVRPATRDMSTLNHKWVFDIHHRPNCNNLLNVTERCQCCLCTGDSEFAHHRTSALTVWTRCNANQMCLIAIVRALSWQSRWHHQCVPVKHLQGFPRFRLKKMTQTTTKSDVLIRTSSKRAPSSGAGNLWAESNQSRRWDSGDRLQLKQSENPAVTQDQRRRKEVEESRSESESPERLLMSFSLFNKK